MSVIYSIDLAMDMINIEEDGEEGDILNTRDPTQTQSALPPFVISTNLVRLDFGAI